MHHALRKRARRWASIAGLLKLAGWAPVTLGILINLGIGLLPIGFIVTTADMLQSISVQIRPQAGHAVSWGGVAPALALAIAAMAAQSVLSPVQSAFSELVARRIDGHCIRRLMAAGLANAPMTALERQDVLDKLSLARSCLTENAQTPGAAAAGLLALLARYVQLAGAVVLAGAVIGPLSGLVLGATAAVARLGSRGSLTRWSTVERSFIRPRRRMRYVLDTGVDIALAKEARVLRLQGWLCARAHADSWSYLDGWWRGRRRIFFLPFLGYSAAVLAGSVVVLLQLCASVAAGAVSVAGLSLAIQAILVPLRMGTFFPECDVQTQYGMEAHDVITELEAQFGESSPAIPAAGAAAATGAAAVTSTTAARGSAARVLPSARMPERSIRCEDVSFLYPGSAARILSGIDLEFPAGSSTAIVGLNGAGKTTLVKLLARLYEPTSGRITVDGVDVRDLDARRWQRKLAVIFQDYVRLELDAAANIGLGGPAGAADDTAILAAADWADARGIVDGMPSGLRTPLSSRYPGGVDLSGGQWQRIALARAFFAIGAGASVLVLDEPTAQLDIRSEVAFFDRFLDITRGLTTIVISHRFSTVRRADQIVVLEHGRIAEQGDHGRLLASNGRYAELFALQARQFTGHGGPAAGDRPYSPEAP
jgi:ATP-binding cassette, subfamily B, bacterial